jgi:signal transduction histidine kinase/CheY-like chemotaxis protein
MKKASTEQLLEALQSLNKTRALEKQARDDAEHLFNALNALANTDSEDEIFSAIKAAIPFERAALFLWETEHNLLSRAAGANLGAETIVNAGSFAKALNGRAMTLMSTAKCSEWAPLNNSPSGKIQSAILVPVGAQNRKGLIICVHPKKSQFNKRHLSILKKFAPLVTQTLNRLQLKTMENTLFTLSKSVALKSQFMATLSHELRTPINGVIGLSQLLSETPLNSEQQAWIRMIKSSGETLLNVVNEVLEFSKVEAGKIELEQERFSPDALCEDLLSLFAFQQSETGVPFYTTIDPKVASGLTGDGGRIKQILVNYLSNAFKHTTKGSIRLTLEVIEQSSQSDPLTTSEVLSFQTLRFTVTDTGIGLSEEDKINVFNEFYQTEYSKQKQIHGTGLGLNITKRIAEMLGGAVGVKDHTGQGCSFWLELSVPTVSFECYESLSEYAVGILADEHAAYHLKSIIQRLGPTPTAIGFDISETHNSDFDCYILHHTALTRQAIKDLPALLPFFAAKCLILLPSSGDNAKVSDIEKFLSGQGGRLDIIKEQTFNRDFFRQYATNGFKISQNDAAPQNGVSRQRKILNDHQILVVDDNEVNQIVISGFLKKLGAKITFANNGLEAVEIYKIKNNFFSLIIMDCQMPICDGYQATNMIRQIQKEQSFRHCPIIGLSAHALPVHYTDALSAGMDDYFSKPVTYSDLQNIIQKHLGSGSTLPPNALLSK